MDCWGSFQKRQIWQMQDTGVVDERPGLIHDAYVRALAYSDACERSMEDTAILPHLSTAYSARDMLEILHKTGHEKLRYWGYSYGTILGGVYATLYPDTIERFVSDGTDSPHLPQGIEAPEMLNQDWPGNVDYTDFFEGDHANFFRDTDSILDAFDDTCHRAGPVKCAFWADNPTAIQERRASLLEKLKDSPVVLPAWAAKTGPEMPLVITYSDVQILLRTMLYKPIKNVERLAQVYAGLERGDGLPYYDATSAYRSGDPMSEQLCAVADVPATEPQETPHEEDAYSAIMCSDGVAVNGTVKDFEEYVEKLKSVSRWAGVASLYFRLPCAGRTVRPKWRVVPQGKCAVIFFRTLKNRMKS
jgi:pimeloyl-ACP methyl ester carboxylesterase